MKHEKVIILSLAYVIGFVTAYIAFGVNSPYFSQDSSVESGDEFSYGLRSSQHKYEKVSVDDESDGLYALLDNKKRILSAQVIDSDKVGPGFHIDVIKSVVSNDKNFIYYCTQNGETEDYMSFIYDVNTDIVHSVGVNSDSKLTINDMETAEWHNDGRLSLGDFVSVKPSEPWLLGTK